MLLLGTVGPAPDPAAAAGTGVGPPAAVATVPLVTDPASLVDPRIGTSGGTIVGGHTFPGADVPFGMVQWGPDTPSRPPGGGYEYTDSAITGFSLTHLSGPGCPAYGDFPILPTVGPIGTHPGHASQPFAHAEEAASPGSYGVSVGAPAIRAELGVSTHGGLGAFTFPATAAANILVKAGGSAAGTDNAGAIVVSPDTIATAAVSGHFCGSATTYTAYAVIRFSRPFTSFGTWNAAGVQPGANGVVGAGTGLYVTFDTTQQTLVQAQVGLSFVSLGGALANLTAEVPDWDLVAMRARARSTWNQFLGRVEIGGGAMAAQRSFYTALYHSLLHPNVFSDVDRTYRGFDGNVHTATGAAHYANISGWDVYRTQIPLLAWLAPAQASDLVSSMLDDAAQNGGRLPKWTLANAETYVMVGDPAAPIIAGAAAFGATGFDRSRALSTLVAQATVASTIRPGLAQYLSLGYLPTDATYGCCSFTGPVSTTLEYASADFAISRLAAGAGQTATADTFSRRAAAWQNVFQATSGVFQQRYSSGQFLVGPNPTTQYGFVEGDALQYAWAVPHDLDGLINAVGGRATAVARLDRFFTQLNTGPSSPYAFMANEPAFAVPWVYVAAGAPHRTADVVRRIETQLFSNAPTGLPGNDDLGATSAWYVWAALGLYPATPGTADLVMGSPLFPRAVVHTGAGTTLTINAPAASSSARYISTLAVDGVASTRAWLPAATVLGGATLDLSLSTAPNLAFGAAPADAPPSYTTGDRPLLGFTNPSGGLVLPPGSSRQITIGAVNATPMARSATWAVAPSGPAPAVTTSWPGGTIAVPASGRAASFVTVIAPSTPGVYQLRFTVASGGVALDPVTLRVVVAAPGDLGPHADNTGISDDSTPARANLDYTTLSYSREALATAGLTAGAAVAVGPLVYRWPVGTGGAADNVVAAGQRIDLAPVPGATTLGVLGSATNAGTGATGTAVITYTDGTRSSFTLGMSDWTRGAGTFPVGFANQVVATLGYVNCQCGSSLPVTAYVYQATTPIDPTRTVAAITLPSSVSSGDLHVFAVALA